MRKKIAIIGAGVSGLSAAWRLLEKDKQLEIEIFESKKIVGGLAATFREDGYCLDIGPHSFFGDNPQTVDLVKKLFDEPLESCERNVKLFHNGRYLNYPFNPFTVLFEMGISPAIKVVASYLASQLLFLPEIFKTKQTSRSVKDWAIRNFGNYLFKSFFKPYTEQFWLIPCSDLSENSIPMHTRTTFTRIMVFLFLVFKRKQKNGDPSLVERECLPTYYPKTGFGEITEKMAENLAKKGVTVKTGEEVTSLKESSQGKFELKLKSQNNWKEFDHVISTIPITNLINKLSPIPSSEILTAASKLEYRPIMVLGIVVNREKVLDSQYVYMLNRPYNRITDMNQFSKFTSPKSEDIILLEIPCLENEEFFNITKNEVFNKCIESLEADNILNRNEVKKMFLIKSTHAYPVFRLNYEKHLKTVSDYLNKLKHLTTLGRTGEFVYLDLEQGVNRVFDYIDKNSELILK